MRSNREHLKKIDTNSEQTEIKMEKVLSEIHSLNNKIMITRYIIGVGFGVIALLITVFKFLG